jgi:hypothetical protein
MRPLLVICLALLTGCGMLPKSPELPKQPDAPTKPDNMTTVGEQIDKSDSRVAAAVTVAQRNADKPEVVKAETAVALSYLPKPSEGDVAYAAARAAKNDAKEYEAAIAYGKTLLAKIDANWAKMEADQAEAKRVSQLKDARIVELQKEVEQVKKDAARNIWTLTGAGLVAAGALACAFASVRIGIPLMLAGAFAGSLPYILDSQWFPWVAGSVIVLFAGLGLYLYWERFHKAPIAVIKGDTDEQPKEG